VTHRLRVLLLLAVAMTVTAPLVQVLPAAATVQLTTVRTVGHEVTASSVLPGRARTLRLPAEARAVAVYWRGAPDAQVRIALSPDGERFAPAVAAGRDEIGALRHDGRTYSALHVTGGTRAVQVDSNRRLAGLTVLGISDGARETRTVRKPQAAAAAVSQPAVIPRSGWGADESLRFDRTGAEIFPEAFYPTQKLVVHHTAGANDDPDPAATVRAIYRYHAVTQGWGDIGYNFLVDEQGRVYEGRHSRDYPVGTTPSGDDAAGNGVTGAHTSGWNSGSVGIALLGTLTSQDATPAARSALVDLLAWEASKNGLDPTAVSPYVNPVSGATVTVPTIAGHRDYAATECPGGTFYATLPALRSAVASRMSGGGPGPAPDTTAPTVPGGLTASAGVRQVSLAWAASTDATGVTGYTVSRSTKSATSGFGTLGSTASTGYTDTGLRTGRRYYYRVQAYDAAGNRSAWSAAVTSVAR
jgi:hypothetical protein